MARRVSRPARPACSTTRATARRACSAAASSRAWRRRSTCRRRARRSVRGRCSEVSFISVVLCVRSGAMTATDLDQGTIEKAYARWAPVYDLVFGAVFDKGRQAAIAAAERIGGRILEVGVGTGISLPDYAPTNRITGVDISVPMLKKARERVATRGLANVDALAVMDAARLAIPDESFDVVVAQYVITAV